MTDNNRNDSQDKQNKQEIEEYCSLCRRPESVCGKLIHMQQNLSICPDCLQKTFDTFNNGGFNIPGGFPFSGFSFGMIPPGGGGQSGNTGSGSRSGSSGHTGGGNRDGQSGHTDAGSRSGQSGYTDAGSRSGQPGGIGTGRPERTEEEQDSGQEDTVEERSEHRGPIINFGFIPADIPMMGQRVKRKKEKKPAPPVLDRDHLSPPQG